MVVEQRKIPRSDLKEILPPRAYKKSIFYNYYAERHDTLEYSVLIKPNWFHHLVFAVLFIPVFLCSVIVCVFEDAVQTAKDLCTEWNRWERSVNKFAKEYFDE